MNLDIPLETRLGLSTLAICTILAFVISLISFGGIKLDDFLNNLAIAITLLIIPISWWALKPFFPRFLGILIPAIRSSGRPNVTSNTTLDEEIEYIENVVGQLFFPSEVPKKDRTLEYHKTHLQHRLIVNYKVYPPKAYYLPTNSYGWKLIEKFPNDLWFSYIDPTPTDDNFIQKYCNEKKFDLCPITAQKKHLLEKMSIIRRLVKHIFVK